MGRVKWKLHSFLKEHNLNAYRLSKTLIEETRAATVYRLARQGKEPQRVDLPTLAIIIKGLRDLTGADVQVSDLLEYHD